MTLEALEQALIDLLESQSTTAQRIALLNRSRTLLHRYSPFADEPVDCVLWIANERIEANDYNPNVMAPVEKRLLQRSLASDGYTQPVVAVAQGERYVVIDGFHRYLLGRKNVTLRQRLQGYLPVTLLVSASEDAAARIAATIRHNRARGKHQIAPMSDIVRDLHRLGWDEGRIGEELGMDADEVLRLKQISGLAELFADEGYSQGWTVD
ncbi:ParB N-terminal domain-containing protein [Edwardsiella piscicida]|uniref:ParB N-terminal domain-containing protein n=1 Tax=Edwardsiella piscicida TaxID=1263550 RepID=UPI001CF1690D|nr:ParB N-terminal domain-containing protein [Edwardsiella piscicida]UCQ30516.1 ParB N-terminal domain-containing protein [Edwardsiella piscicida]UCQ56841.1 ParB N-terminal domain-containing protein [Edwardsiella piscicida]